MRNTLSCYSCLFVCVVSLTSLYGNSRLEAADNVLVYQKQISINTHLDRTIEIIPEELVELVMVSERTVYYGLRKSIFRKANIVISDCCKQGVFLFHYDSSIKVGIYSKFRDLLIKSTLIQASLIKPEKNEDKAMNSSKSDKPKTYYWIFSGFFAGLIIGALGVYFYSRKMIYLIIDTEKKKYLNELKRDPKLRSLERRSFKYIGVVAVLKQSKNKKEEELRKLKQVPSKSSERRTDLTKGKVIDNKNDQDDSDRNMGSFINYPIEETKENSILKETAEELFFTIPESDGCFKNSHALNLRQVDSLYKIVVDRSGERGSLHYLSGNYDLRALDNIEYYLNPVCEIENITNRLNAIKIQMIDQGAVIRAGDTWRIENNKKVIVKLI